MNNIYLPIKINIRDIINHLSKIIVIASVLFLFTGNNKVNAQDTYTLEFSDTSTYDNTCGVVKPSQWSVRKDSCTLYTPFFRKETAGCGTVGYDFLVNQSGNGDSNDHVYIQYQINDGPWITDTILQASSYNAVHHVTGSFTLCYNEVIRVRVILVTDSNTEFWQIKNNDLTMFGSFQTYPVSPIPLPVDLSSFNVYCKSYGTLINWTTNSEINNDYFTVEKSYNLKDWTIVAIVNGSNSSNTVQSYSVNDYFTSHDRIYYRLKQTDLNGEYKNYNPKVRQCSYLDGFAVTDAYNFDKSAHVNYTVNEISQVSFEIYNIEGKLLKKEIEIPEIGENSKTLNSSELQKGIYFIILTQENKRLSNKIIIN